MHSRVRIPGIIRKRRLGHSLTGRSHDIVRRGTVRPRARLGRVRKRQTSRVDNSVVPNQRNGHLRRLPNPQPLASKLRNVRHDAQHRFLTTIHSLGLDVAEPHLQRRRKVIARQFQHRHVPSAVQMQRMHDRNGRNRRPDRSHPFVELILGLVRRNNRPTRPVVNHLLIRLLRTRRRLELYDPLLRQAQVHPFRVLHVKRAFVQLRNGIVRFKERLLLVDLEKLRQLIFNNVTRLIRS